MDGPTESVRPKRLHPFCHCLSPKSWTTTPPCVIHLIPSLHNFDQVEWSYLEAATGGEFECVLQLPINSLLGWSFQHHVARLPISKGGCGLRSVSETSGPAFIGAIEMSLPFFTGDFGVAPGLEAVIGRPDQYRAARWGPLIRNGSRTGQYLTKNETKQDCVLLASRSRV